MFGTWKTTYKFEGKCYNITMEVTTWRELDEDEKGQLPLLIEQYIAILKAFDALDVQKILVYPKGKPHRAKQLFP